MSFFGAALFGLYLIVDIQLIMGNQSRRIGMDDYVFAAINLYLDVINIFLYILRILGEK